MDARKRKFLFWVTGLVCLGLVLLIWGRTPVQDPPIILPDLTAARAVHIEQDWSGENSLAPVKAHYDLVSGETGFRGTGFFSMASYSGEPVTATEEIAIPIGMMGGVLSKLQQVHAQKGTYPTPSCCDNYPSLRIDVQLPTETIAFFSTSTSGDWIIRRPPNNGDPWRGLYGHVPWGLGLRGQTYIINSPLPAQALATIQGYLRRDVLDRLVDEYNARYIKP